jgi:hypothetical protein
MPGRETSRLTTNPVATYGICVKHILAGLLIAGTSVAADLDSQFAFENEIIREWNTTEYPVVSQRGKQALQINPATWQHLQSAHFVFHFVNRGVAVRTAQESEFYLRWIRQALELDQADTDKKSHVFIFENPEDWKQFTKAATLDPWTGGFFDGLDLYFWRKTGLGVLNSDQTLPHEITHRVFYEKYPAGSIPLAFHEGFAEYEARKLAFRYLRPRHYNVRVSSNRVPRDKFLSAEKLLETTTYPQDDGSVEAFYDESERLVNFLMEKHGLAKFRDLMQALAGGQRFHIALLQVYSKDYNSMDQFERVFADYAILQTK